ncbi:MAG: hypothetical protein U0002_09340 [Thermoanaerobaculia bacterium]
MAELGEQQGQAAGEVGRGVGLEVQLVNLELRRLERQHPDRPQGGGPGEVDRLAAGDVELRAGDHPERQRPATMMLGEGHAQGQELGERGLEARPEQSPGIVLDRPRAQAPQMHHGGGLRPGPGELAEELRELLPALEVEPPGALLQWLQSLAGVEHHGPLALARELRHEPLGEPGRVGHQEPALRGERPRGRHHRALEGGHLEPLVEVQAPARPRRAGLAASRLHPVALAGEGIARQRQPQPPLLAPVGAPGEGHAGAPQPAAGAEQHLEVRGLVLGMGQGGQGQLAPGAVHPPAAEGGQGPPRAHLEQDHFGILEQQREPVAEAHGAAQMAGPVGRVRGVLGLDPAAAQVGDVGQPGRPEREAGQVALELGEDRLDHRRVGGDVDVHPAEFHSRGRELGRRPLEPGPRPGEHRLGRAVDGGDR